MTAFFAYEELTWPEVKSLSRDTPLIIPLGSGYPLEQLSSALSFPASIGLLPPIPFGWRGSGLAVRDEIFQRYLLNLNESLRDDGFSRTFVLTPQGLDWNSSPVVSGLGASRISLPLSPTHQSSLPGDEQRGKVILLPVGHTEQHGYHLPLSTDTLIIDAVSKGTANKVPNDAFCLPVMPYGVSTHRSSFPGTLNTGGRAFEDFWLNVIDVLAARGFDRFFFLSGHGGNVSFLVNVVKYAGDRYKRIFCATSWLYLSGPEGIKAIEEYRRSSIGGMGHACELETSIVLHLRPDLVHMDRVVDETDFIATPSYYMDWVEGGSLIANPPWEDDSITGAYGAGSLATKEHGQLWLEAAIDEKISQVNEIHEQHRRREERRRNGYGLWGKNQKT